MTWARKSFVVGVSIVAVPFVFIVLIPFLLKSTYSIPSLDSDGLEATSIQTVLVTHLETPEPLKALYMTACVAGTPSWRESLKKLIEATELNAVIIDIKDYTGSISYREDANCYVNDLKEFIRELHEANIYVIGRISVFQDSSYTKTNPELAVKKKSDGGVWKDHKGLAFIDVGAKPYWDYIIDISRESYELGFDELNYDYVLYPSDGNMQDTSYTWAGTTTKPIMLKNFFEYLHNEMSETGAKLSVDLFGMTTTVENDMNIGQVLENALPYFDYVAPMVYPSHYPATWNGFANPADHPYEVIKISMSSAVKRELAWNVGQSRASTTPSRLRPWLQDFDLGATYDAEKVRDQIQATYDVGLTSWMLWNAGNKYTKEALLPN